MSNLIEDSLRDPSNEEKIKAVFNHYDIDHSNSLTRDEFVKFTTDLVEVKKKEDPQFLEKLNVQEGQLEDFVDKLIFSLDKNFDGKISFNEFKVFLPKLKYKN
eukprot:TRINITY_DN573_c0_g1_i1.p1 TRINITY_DN573_c0_g1~~TRINITY_DN573_c0_g1_i1.p1  ORF type:complete len:103 (-),score=41.32 TRINITY_DN573_c0_g1_i1:246-554(-)